MCRISCGGFQSCNRCYADDTTVIKCIKPRRSTCHFSLNFAKEQLQDQVCNHAKCASWASQLGGTAAKQETTVQDGFQHSEAENRTFSSHVCGDKTIKTIFSSSWPNGNMQEIQGLQEMYIGIIYSGCCVAPDFLNQWDQNHQLHCNEN